MTYEPVVCTLITEDAESQVVEWSVLGESATSVAKVHGGAIVTFPSQLQGAVSNLARREAECCAFLTLTVESDDGETRLSITSDNPDARPVIDALSALMGQ